jgi:hypothetical protein
LISSKNQKNYPPRPALIMSGRIAIVTNVERGMRLTLSISPTSEADADAKACGPGAPTLAPSRRDVSGQT